MGNHTVLLSLALAGMASMGRAADPVDLTACADDIVNRVDPKIYGHFLEHIYHSCNGGLWGELIWDRSFEGGGAGVAWESGDGTIAQYGGGSDVRLTFGSEGWTDYTFEVEARKTGGAEGFLILVRAIDNREFYWANLGGWGNDGHALERGTKDGNRWRSVTPRRPGRIEEDRWYRIRARCEGPTIRVWLDGEMIIDYTDDGRGPTHGQAGVGTWLTQAEFRNFKVTALDGTVLHEGQPPLPEDAAPAIPGWREIGPADTATTTDDPLNGSRCRRIVTAGGGGIAQQPIRVTKDEAYKGSVWIRGRAPEGLLARLVDGDAILAEQILPPPTAEWTDCALLLTPRQSTDNAALQILVRGAGRLWLDQLSLMPVSWRKAGGFRPDLLAAINELQPPIIRWPGGCFASPYRWKDGIGPQHERGAHPRTMWDDKDVNSFGTDEFIAMCRAVGAEPLIVVNIGTRNWNADVQDNDFLRETLDWIEYCNGPADSPWGQVRAENGHPEPYNVRYWEIDNETWHMGAERYADAVNRFAPAMRAADPSIELIACGSGGFDRNWNRVVIQRSGAAFDYISTHHYENPDNFATGPQRSEAFFNELGEIIKAGPNPAMKIYCSEWNAQSTDWRTGLYCGGILNVFERCGDVFEIGGPALFLRHVSASGWDNAFINFDRTGWFPAPNHVVMKLWREHAAPNRIRLDGETKGLNAVATTSEDGDRVILKAVNPTDRAKHVTLRFAGGFKPGKASMLLVAPGALTCRNTLDDRDAVRARPADAETRDGCVTVELPPYSAGVLTVRSRRWWQPF